MGPGAGGQFGAVTVYPTVPSTNMAVDVTALVTIPEAGAWFLNPSQTTQLYGDQGNGFVLDDVVGDQFTIGPQSAAPSPTPLPSSSIRVTPFSRGLIPAPDPKNGLPIFAVISVAPGVSPNPQTSRLSAQLAVLERTRYVLP